MTPRTAPNGITIDAALLALYLVFVRVNSSQYGGTEGDLDRLWLDPAIRPGSDRHVQRQFALATGYEKHDSGDPLLDFISPPNYPGPVDGLVGPAVGHHQRRRGLRQCLSAPASASYTGLDVQGVATTGPAITVLLPRNLLGNLSRLPDQSTVPSPPTTVTATVSACSGSGTRHLGAAPASNRQFADHRLHGGARAPSCKSCNGS